MVVDTIQHGFLLIGDRYCRFIAKYLDRLKKMSTLLYSEDGLTYLLRQELGN